MDKVKTPYAYAFFENFWNKLFVAGLVQQEDRLVFEELCFAFELMVRARKTLLDEGLSEVDRAHGGMLKKHPAFQIYRDTQASFLKLAAKFGITPADRKELGVGIVESNFDLEELLGGVNVE